MSTTSQLSIHNGGPETAPASEDESSFTNADRRSLSWIFPVQKLELAESPHREKCGREISFGDCNDRIYPRLLVEIDRWRALEGGNATTRMGNLILFDNQPILVAFKVIKLNPDVEPLKYRERLNREVNVWGGLRHPNILPFLGAYDIGHDVPVLISPYYKFGHIGRYLQCYPCVDRNKLVRDVASGLKYLHDRGVVHGDLKAENTLVDQHGDACICDFGISRISNIEGFTTSNRAGTMVYMAPELFEEHGALERPAPRTTFESDTWAFGLVALGTLTTFPLLTAKGLEGLRFVILPSRAYLENRLRPSRGKYGSVPLEMWSVLERCWSSDPKLRPTITAILESRLIQEMEEEVVYPRQPGR
ncbi:kinase-like domain-containing protein [Mycena leptocephala]|nr:kinase-like domain-containing protein [Mycena leptocephala]